MTAGDWLPDRCDTHPGRRQSTRGRRLRNAVPVEVEVIRR